MSDRPLRLGDVIDDYCPRCRLLLNHDIASLAGGAVAKVTCRTCYNTHDYRHAPGAHAAQDEEGRRQEPDGPGAGVACRTSARRRPPPPAAARRASGATSGPRSSA